MAISTFASLLAKVAAPSERVFLNKISSSSVTQLVSTWANTQQAGAAPTTAAAPTSATTGAIGQQNGGANALRLVGGDLYHVGGVTWICDRLSHQGGLSGTAGGAQTTNLPTAALTRYTGGVGVMIALEIYTAIGATGTTVSASYTNSAGTSGRTTPLTTIGGSGFSEANRFLILPYASGDVGVKSVESVTLTATTGTVGNFGVTLFMPLVPFGFPTAISYSQNANAMLDFGGFMPEIVDNACLWPIIHAIGTSAGVQADLRFAED
jgi:hypothetical protein